MYQYIDILADLPWRRYSEELIAEFSQKQPTADYESQGSFVHSPAINCNSSIVQSEAVVLEITAWYHFGISLQKA